MSDALALGARLAAGELDPVELCEAALARARASTSVFTALCEERARREALASRERLRAGAPRGPLDGVPVAVKDLIDVAGTPTTAASELRRDTAPAAADAPAVARLAAAGMVCVGKTNLSELAFSGLGLNPHYGTPPNPRARGCAPGGSSSGSAVAVAAGIVPVALGTDTSGSIRVPAAFCGIAGFKPTAARVDRRGVLPLAPTLDSVGPLATSVRDLVAVDAALRGDPADGDVAPRLATPLVVPDGAFADDVEPAVGRAFAAAVAALGVPVRRRAIPALDAARAAFDAHGSLVAHEAWRTHAALLDGPDAERLDPVVLRRLRDGRALAPGGHAALLAARPRLQAALADQLRGALLLLPTAPIDAPPLAPIEHDVERFLAVNARALRTTMPASYLDMPGVALPLAEGSLLVTGAAGDDDRVLATALAVEARI
jgi:aspartyl-tRNA(Asn)/glutamyl-tRNA(Gln) amidotransferase subunit A